MGNQPYIVGVGAANLDLNGASVRADPSAGLQSRAYQPFRGRRDAQCVRESRTAGRGREAAVVRGR